MRTIHIAVGLIAVGLALLTSPVWAQDASHVRKLLEAGQYQQVVDTSASPEAPPEVVYMAAQGYQKLGNSDLAVQTYQRLAQRPEGDPWGLIGLSGQQLIGNQNEQARDSAQQAVGAAPDLPEAQFQLGLVLARLQDWAGGADAFERATTLNPAMAQAHYYGGLAYYRANRPGRMATHFDQFLKLAPDAPERPEVTQIMRTVRGR